MARARMMASAAEKTRPSVSINCTARANSTGGISGKRSAAVCTDSRSSPSPAVSRQRSTQRRQNAHSPSKSRTGRSGGGCATCRGWLMLPVMRENATTTGCGQDTGAYSVESRAGTIHGSRFIASMSCGWVGLSLSASAYSVRAAAGSPFFSKICPSRQWAAQSGGWLSSGVCAR